MKSLMWLMGALMMVAAFLFNHGNLSLHGNNELEHDDFSTLWYPLEISMDGGEKEFYMDIPAKASDRSLNARNTVFRQADLYQAKGSKLIAYVIHGEKNDPRGEEAVVGNFFTPEGLNAAFGLDDSNPVVEKEEKLELHEVPFYSVQEKVDRKGGGQLSAQMLALNIVGGDGDVFFVCLLWDDEDEESRDLKEKCLDSLGFYTIERG